MSADDALRRPVATAGGDRPFGELTPADVRARAEELRAACGWGPTARVAPVARAWAELARTMSEAGATCVADLGAEAADDFARRLWVVPPAGSLL